MSTLFFKFRDYWQEHVILDASIAIIVSTCLGGLAIFSLFQNGKVIFQLIEVLFVVVPCGSVLAYILTVQNPKMILNTILVSLSICFLISLVNYIIYY